MINCILVHSPVDDLISAYRERNPDEPARLVVEEQYPVSFAVQCRHCDDPFCVTACLTGAVTDLHMLYRPSRFYDGHRVNLLLGRKAVRLEPSAAAVELDTGERLKYDRLLLACGGRPIIPPGLENVPYHTFHTWEDVRRLAAEIRSRAPGQSALVIGGGLVGMKAAESLRLLGIEVTVVDLANRLLSSILTLSAGKFLEDLISTDAGLHLYLNTTATELRLAGDKIEAKIMGTRMRFDHLIVAIGVRPNLELCQGISINTNKGIIVDEHMRTNLPSVYAAGDLVESIEPVSGESRLTGILPSAAYQGRVAGAAMAGAAESSKPHTIFNSLSIFNHSLVTIGLTTADADSVTDIDGFSKYRQFFYTNQRLCGVILIDQPERSGIYRYIIENKVELKSAQLFEPKLISLPQSLRQSLGIAV